VTVGCHVSVSVPLDFLPHRANLFGREVTVPHPSPTTPTADEQCQILRATVGNVRDHTIISLALGAGLRLAEIVGLNVGDVLAPDGITRVRVRACGTRPSRRCTG
jgi:site-specific recombinase XerC